MCSGAIRADFLLFRDTALCTTERRLTLVPNAFALPTTRRHHSHAPVRRWVRPAPTNLDEAVKQVGAVLDVDIHICEQLAQPIEDLVEVRQYVASRHLSQQNERGRCKRWP